MTLSFLQFLFGLALLIGGSDLLIRGSSSLAVHLKTKVFFISLFLLGMGSSAPELFVTLESHLNLEPDIAIGNIIGSNIFNILIVSALVILSAKQIQNQKIMIQSTVLLLVTSLLAGIVVLDYSLSRWNGLFLLGLFILFFIQPKDKAQTFSKKGVVYSIPFLIVLFIAGFAFLFLGAQRTIDSAVDIGSYLGLSKRLIGLFLMSIGTSLPELTLGLVALFKKNSEMALGGIIGSNAFNTLFIPGIASLFFALPVSATLLKMDAVIMLISTLLLLIFFFANKKIPKSLSAGVFLISYFIYAYFVLFHRI